MGLLDDAIREHLELKRRRGADATEVAAQEQEALGPVPRGEPSEAVEAPLTEPAGDVYEEGVGAEEVPADAMGYEPVVEAEPQAYEPEPVAEPVPEVAHQETVAYDVESALAQEEEAPEHAPEREARAEPVPAAEPEPAAEPAHEQPAPQEARAPQEPAPEQAESEDVLEETPDFLSETPEHDRLWFEQKPPKDFDF